MGATKKGKKDKISTATRKAKIQKKNLKFLKSCCIEVINTIAIRFAKQNNFGFSRKERVSVTTEIDLHFRKTILRSVNVQKNFRQIIFQDLTALNCPFRALDRFVNAHYKTYYTFSHRNYAIGLQKQIGKTSKRNSKFH